MSENTAQQTSDVSEETAASDSVHDLRNNLVEGYHELEETYLTTKEQVYALNRRAIQFVQDNPGACVVGAVAIGFMVGRLAKKRWLV